MGAFSHLLGGCWAAFKFLHLLGSYLGGSHEPPGKSLVSLRVVLRLSWVALDGLGAFEVVFVWS